MIRVWEPNTSKERKRIFYSIVDDVWKERKKRDWILTSQLESFLAGRHTFSYAVAVSSGGAGIELYLWYLKTQLDIRKVVIPSVAYYANVVAPYMMGYEIYVADVRDDYPVMSVESLLKLHEKYDLSDSVIMPVMELGVFPPWYVEKLNSVAKEIGEVFYDLSHCYGLGNMGKFVDNAVMSFFTTKMLDGDNAGAIMTNDGGREFTLKRMREYGRTGKTSSYPSMNYGLSEFSAAYILSGILEAERRLDRAKKLMWYIIDNYGDRVANMGKYFHNGYAVAIKVRYRDRAEKKLKENGIEPWESTIPETMCDFMNRYKIPYKGWCVNASRFVYNYVYLSPTTLNRETVDKVMKLLDGV